MLGRTGCQNGSKKFACWANEKELKHPGWPRGEPRLGPILDLSTLNGLRGNGSWARFEPIYTKKTQNQRLWACMGCQNEPERQPNRLKHVFRLLFLTRAVLFMRCPHLPFGSTCPAGVRLVSCDQEPVGLLIRWLRSIPPRSSAIRLARWRPANGLHRHPFQLLKPVANKDFGCLLMPCSP